MPINLTAQGGADFRANVQALDAAQARQTLEKIQKHLSQPGRGTGTLTLFNRTNAEGELRLERKSGFQLLGRGARLKDTNDVLKTLLDRAGLPEARAELERHAGTRHRVGAAQMLAILNRHLVDYSKLSGSSLEHLLAQAGLQRGARLGAGSFGQIFKVRGGAEPMVLKTFVAGSLPLSNQRDQPSNEAIAAYLTSKVNHRGAQINLVQPKYFVVRLRGEGKFCLVEPLVLRRMLKERTQTLECVGLLMPEAKGREVGQLHAQQQLTPENRRQILQGTLEAVKQLNARGFIHHDLKLDNLFFDPASGKTTLIDTGMLHKSSKHDPASQFVRGTFGAQLYLHPRALKGAKHGSEVDLHATAVLALLLEHGEAGQRLVAKLCEIAQEESTGEIEHPHLRKVDDPARLLQAVLDQRVPDPKRDPFAEIRRSLRDENSLTSFALACLRKAGKPAEEWADRATAQGIYAELLQHPSLRKA